MTNRLTIVDLQRRISVTPDGIFGGHSKLALFAVLSNPKAPALTEADYKAAAERLGVPVGHIKGVRRIEAPRGPYDRLARPTILYERHKFSRHTEPRGRYDDDHPTLSGPPYGPGGYGAFNAQYDRLAAACALDPHAAFSACSWGAFQVLGENAEALGYSSPFDFAISLKTSEAAHLDSFVRYVLANKIDDQFRACKPNDAASCQAFVRRYNGPNFRQFHYDTKLAAAIAM